MSPDPSPEPTPRSRAIDRSIDAVDRLDRPSRPTTRDIDRRHRRHRPRLVASSLSSLSSSRHRHRVDASFTLHDTRGPFASIRPYLEGCRWMRARPRRRSRLDRRDRSTRTSRTRPSSVRSVIRVHPARAIVGEDARFDSIDRAIDRVDRVAGAFEIVYQRTLGTTAARAATRFCARAGLAASGINPVFNAKATMTACV